MLPVSQVQRTVSPQTGPAAPEWRRCAEPGGSRVSQVPHQSWDSAELRVRVAPFLRILQCKDIVVKFIVAFFKENLQYPTMNGAISAISKHHVRLPTGETIAHHPLVQQAKKAFWQQRPPPPRYRCTYDAGLVLKYLA